MTDFPMHAPRPAMAINWAAVSAIAVLLIQFAAAVTFGASASAEIRELKSTTEPIRRGDLVAIQTDVAWIRKQMEASDR